MDELSLREHCIPCESKCCKTGDSIASPILSEDEALNIKESLKKIVFSGGEYYLIEEQEGTNRCAFLTEKGECQIQDKKPLDCLCYPIKAVYDGKEIVYVVDINCPGAEHLTPKFIEKAKEVALESISRFSRETYEHWINNHEIWARDAVRIG